MSWQISGWEQWNTNKPIFFQIWVLDKPTTGPFLSHDFPLPLPMWFSLIQPEDGSSWRVMVSLVGWVHISFILKTFQISAVFWFLAMFSSVQSFIHVWLFVTPWTATCQTSLFITNFQSLFKLMSIESGMPSNHLILCSKAIVIPWRRAWQPTPIFLPGESPWTEEPDGLQSMGSQRVGHDRETKHKAVVIRPPHKVFIMP